MKSYVLYIQGLYAAILSQIAESYPNMSRECDRDLSRLLSLIDSNGIPFVMITLPEAGKHFDKCLAAERLIPSSLAGQRPHKKGSVIPRLFKGLLKRVFDDSGCLLSTPDIQAIKHLRQLYYLAKKVKIPCDDSKTWKQVNEFFRIDSQVQNPTLDWVGDELDVARSSSLHFGDTITRDRAVINNDLFDHCEGQWDPRILSYDMADAIQWVADAISSEIGHYNPESWGNKHGPGAVSDLKSTQFKYDFPNWPEKLGKVFPLDYFGFANYSHWIDHLSSKNDSRFSKHEPPAKLMAVPKTLKGPRLITVEPTSHQWAQQSVRQFLADRISAGMLRSTVHLNDQEHNKGAALRASHTQSHVTVDLSSASDRLSCWVVERVFRNNSSLLLALHASRTRWWLTPSIAKVLSTPYLRSLRVWVLHVPFLCRA